MLKVGQKVKRPVPVMKEPGAVSTVIRHMEGEVIFVHSQGRFHTVEFDYGRGKLKISYDGVD